MAIIGPSGSGKSSLLNVLGGLDAPSAGKAWVAGIDLMRMSPAERLRYRRRTVGFVWQNIGRNLIPYLSAVENVEMPMILAGTFHRQRAHRLLELVGLGHRKHHQPQHMSGGEQQSGSSSWWASATASTISRSTCQAASSRGWLSP
jgi:ABC-type lipoprotein export system ATPase subunit